MTTTTAPKMMTVSTRVVVLDVRDPEAPSRTVFSVSADLVDEPGRELPYWLVEPAIEVVEVQQLAVPAGVGRRSSDQVRALLPDAVRRGRCAEPTYVIGHIPSEFISGTGKAVHWLDWGGRDEDSVRLARRGWEVRVEEINAR